MFFYLSKIAWFFIQPLNLALLFLLAGPAAGWFGRRGLPAVGASLAFLILALSAWTSLGALMIEPLEQRFQRPATLPEKVAGIVILSGGMESAINLARGGYELNSAGDRFVEGAILARRYPDARIVVTGGVPTLFQPEEGDAVSAPRLLTALGVAPERLILEGKSRNTYENAMFTAALVKPRPGETWLLVTSAFHMPRSKALFDKAGFPTVPWPVDYRSTGRDGVALFAGNPVDALANTTTALREWVGLLAYWLTGKIDSPFPSPAR